MWCCVFRDPLTTYLQYPVTTPLLSFLGKSTVTLDCYFGGISHCLPLPICLCVPELIIAVFEFRAPLTAQLVPSLPLAGTLGRPASETSLLVRSTRQTCFILQHKCISKSSFSLNCVKITHFYKYKINACSLWKNWEQQNIYVIKYK